MDLAIDALQAFDSISGIGTALDAPTYRTTGSVEVMHRLIRFGLRRRGAVRADLFCQLMKIFFARDLAEKQRVIKSWDARGRTRMEALASGRTPAGQLDPAVQALKRFVPHGLRSDKQTARRALLRAQAVVYPGADEQTVRDRMVAALEVLALDEGGEAVLAGALVASGIASEEDISSWPMEDLMAVGVHAPKEAIQRFLMEAHGRAAPQLREEAVAEPVTAGAASGRPTGQSTGAMAPAIAEQLLAVINPPAPKPKGRGKHDDREQWGKSIDHRRQRSAAVAAADVQRGPVSAPKARGNGKAAAAGGRARRKKHVSSSSGADSDGGQISNRPAGKAKRVSAKAGSQQRASRVPTQAEGLQPMDAPGYAFQHPGLAPNWPVYAGDADHMQWSPPRQPGPMGHPAVAYTGHPAPMQALERTLAATQAASVGAAAAMMGQPGPMGHPAVAYTGHPAPMQALERTLAATQAASAGAAAAMMGQPVFVALLQDENTREPYWIMRTDGTRTLVTEADVQQAHQAGTEHEEAKRGVLYATSQVQSASMLLRSLSPEHPCAAQAQATAHAARKCLADAQAAELEAEEALTACIARCPTMGIIFEPGTHVLRGQYLELWNGLGYNGLTDRLYEQSEKAKLYTVGAQIMLAAGLQPTRVLLRTKRGGGEVSARDASRIPAVLWQISEPVHTLIMTRKAAHSAMPSAL